MQVFNADINGPSKGCYSLRRSLNCIGYAVEIAYGGFEFLVVSDAAEQQRLWSSALGFCLCMWDLAFSVRRDMYPNGPPAIFGGFVGLRMSLSVSSAAVSN